MTSFLPSFGPGNRPGHRLCSRTCGPWLPALEPRRPRGVAGLDPCDGKADLMQSLLEGIALRTAEVLQAMAALHPLRGPVSVDGGLSRNAHLVQILSEVGAKIFSCRTRPNRPPQASRAWQPRRAALTFPTPDRDGACRHRMTLRLEPDDALCGGTAGNRGFAAQVTG